jgi:hypothetical protein
MQLLPQLNDEIMDFILWLIEEDPNFGSPGTGLFRGLNPPPLAGTLRDEQSFPFQ